MLTRRRLAIAIALVLFAAVAALAVSSWVWAKSYSPLRVTAYGPGFGVSERPAGASDSACTEAFNGCGHLAFVVHGKGTHVAEFQVVVKNDGRWPVTIRRADLHSYCTLPINVDNCFELQSLRQGPPRYTGARAPTAGPFRPLRVAAHASADVWVRMLTSCYKHETGYRGGSYALPLVYRYLSVFERTQNVSMPFDIDFVC
jgi:hypothetical protein